MTLTMLILRQHNINLHPLNNVKEISLQFRFRSKGYFAVFLNKIDLKCYINVRSSAFEDSKREKENLQY